MLGRARQTPRPRADHDPGTQSLAGTTDTTAQVTPGNFTAVIAEAAKEKGVQISIATVTELHDKGNGTREVVAVDDNGDRITFIATDVVFAAGPWTGRLAKQLLGDKAGPAADVQPRCVAISALEGVRVTLTPT